MEAQGYDIDGSKLCQDNMSAIRVENHGQLSCGQRSKHINIRYFFIKDRLKGSQIKIMYCPTDKMVADFLTKPLQGKLFLYLRDFLMGHAPIHHLDLPEYQELNMPCQERVGKNEAVVDSGPQSQLDTDQTADNDIIQHGMRTYKDALIGK